MNIEELRLGKLLTKQKCIECALLNTPPTVTVIYPRKNLSGRAFTSIGRMDVCRPFTRKSLYIFLHECAHFHLHIKSPKYKHVIEYEAEQWAHQKMREFGIAVPRSMTTRAKRYVARKIDQAIKHGIKKIHPEARKFSSYDRRN